MSSNAQQFAATVLAAFKTAGHHTDQEIVDAGGPSTTTLTNLRKLAEGGGSGTTSTFRGDTLRKIDTAARWKIGSARALGAQGMPPVPAPPSVSELLSGAASTAQQQREAFLQRRRSGSDYQGHLLDRILEVEERLDLLEARLSEAPASIHTLAADIDDDMGKRDRETEEPTEP